MLMDASVIFTITYHEEGAMPKVTDVEAVQYTLSHALTVFEGVLPSIVKEVEALENLYFHSDLVMPQGADALGAILLGCAVLLDAMKQARKDLHQ